MKIEQGMESPRQGNAENDPRRGGCGKPHDGRNNENQRKAADAADGKVVRKFKKVNADGGEQHAKGQQNIAFELAHRFGRSGFHGRYVPFS